jgi:sugar phosphate isomerase/epimerase
MSSRRRFLGTLAAGLGASAFRPSGASAATTPEAKSPLGGPIGVQLWSLKAYLPKDAPGTLARLRGLGIREVEGAGLAGMPIDAFRAALDKADLVCHSAHMDFERIRTDAPGALKEAKALGVKYLVCPWIPHEGTVLTREVALKAIDVFNAIGKAAKAEGVRFCYHAHGYEFVPSTEGTLFDTIAKQTDPALVSFEIDLFWAKAGGVDPAKLVASLSGRVPLLHIKDMKKGLALPPASSGAPEDSDVAAGTGQLDFPAILRAARKSGTEIYYIEDESTKPWDQIPESIKYLTSLKL